jgi:hypothetical protein
MYISCCDEPTKVFSSIASRLGEGAPRPKGSSSQGAASGCCPSHSCKGLRTPRCINYFAEQVSIAACSVTQTSALG